jgi:hypothetical protein
MAQRLWSDIKDGSNRRYWYDLDGSPGVLTPGVATLTISGGEPQYPGSVFRNPAQITLTVNGLQPRLDVPLIPAQAALTFSNAVIGQLIITRTISPSLESPVESPPNDFVPTLHLIMTVAPTTGSIVMATSNHSLSQGGNIGFLTPTTAALTLSQLSPLRVISNADPVALTIDGRAPALQLEVVLIPAVAALSFGMGAPTAQLGFIWIDDDPAPLLAWG